MSIEKQLDELFMTAFRFNPCLMAVSEVSSGIYICVNEAFLQTLEYSKTEIIGKSTLELEIFADYRDRCNALQIMQEKGCIRKFESYISCKNGRLLFGKFNAEFIKVQGKSYLLTVFNDITAKKQLEQEVGQLEKLHLIGQLAAGISHEVRNPLTTVKGFLQLLAKKPEFAPQLEYYKLMISEIDRANFILSEFLAIAKKNPDNEKYARISLDKLLNQMKLLINSDALKTNHEVDFQVAEDCYIVANESEIKQIILNLSRNGFEAMPSCGKLTISTFRENDKIVLTVKDQGTGIDQTVLNMLGTPFISTKENGTGLGLAVCYGIARRHNARIEVDTGLQGTTFNFYFPCAN